MKMDSVVPRHMHNSSCASTIYCSSTDICSSMPVEDLYVPYDDLPVMHNPRSHYATVAAAAASAVTRDIYTRRLKSAMDWGVIV